MLVLFLVLGALCITSVTTRAIDERDVSLNALKNHVLYRNAVTVSKLEDYDDNGTDHDLTNVIQFANMPEDMKYSTESDLKEKGVTENVCRRRIKCPSAPTPCWRNNCHCTSFDSMHKISCESGCTTRCPCIVRITCRTTCCPITTCRPTCCPITTCHPTVCRTTCPTTCRTICPTTCTSRSTCRTTCRPTTTCYPDSCTCTCCFDR